MKLSKWIAMFTMCAMLTATGVSCGLSITETSSQGSSSTAESSFSSSKKESSSRKESSSSSSFASFSEQSSSLDAESSSIKNSSTQQSASSEDSFLESSEEDSSSSFEDSSSEDSSSSFEDSSSEDSSSSFEDSSFEEEEEDSSFWEDEEGNVDDIYYLTADGSYAALDIKNSISDKRGRMSFITKTSYKGIKRIAFNAKTGDVTSWWGIALSEDPSEASLYNTDLTVGRTVTGGFWVTFVYEFNETGCRIYSTQGGYNPKSVTEWQQVPYTTDGEYYIHFVGPLWEDFSEPIGIDNFTIELLDGSTYVDTFDFDVNSGLFNADKAVTHVVEELVEDDFSEVEETPMYETNAVYYETDDQIDFTAYAPVTVENWGGSWTSNPNLVTDRQYRYMAEAGFTKSLGLYEGRSGDTGYTSNEKAEKDALAVLEFAEKYGIKYYVLNERFYNFVRPGINIEFFDLTNIGGEYYNIKGEVVSSYDSYRYLKSNWMDLYRSKMSEMFDVDTQYIDSFAYGGNFASDEPALPTLVDGEWYYGELEQLYYQLLIYNELMGENSLYGGEAYVNLLPYGWISEDNRQRYNAMLDYYFEKIAPLLGYICYDQYPLNAGAAPYISATHLLNLEIVANYCKKYDVEFRSFLWAKTVATGHRALIGAKDLRFQAYSNLAFGVREMPYYTYFNYYAPGDDAGDSLIDCQTGARTKSYYWAKTVNNEIHAMEKAYLHFDWEGTMYFDAGIATQQLALLETSMTSHERLTNIEASADTLVGVFKDEDGANGATDGFIVMNYSDPYYAEKGAKENVVLTFAEATHVLVYKLGKQYVAELSEGTLSMYLEAGEGVFVVPFTA